MKNSHPQRITLLREFYEQHKRLPSYSEMLSLFNLKSKNSIARIVQKLIAQKIVTKDERGHLVAGAALLGVKILGDITAGFPSPAEEELADAVSLDDYMIEKKEATFLLRVSGESMINAGICPGDLVIVERGREPKNEDIVIAQVDNEWTLKRFRKQGGRIELVPENPKFKTIIPQADLAIDGVVTGVIRKYK